MTCRLTSITFSCLIGACINVGTCFMVSPDDTLSDTTVLARLTSSRSLILSGKSTIGISLADAFNIPFIDGDSLHPKSNVEKMSAGTPLTDDDRLPWLALIRATAERVCREEWVTKEQGLFGVLGDDGNLNRDVEDLAELADWEFGEGWKWKKNLKKGTDESLGVPKEGLGRPAVVIACSALKKWYRDILRGHHPVEMPVQEISGEDTDEASLCVTSVDSFTASETKLIWISPPRRADCRRS